MYKRNGQHRGNVRNPGGVTDHHCADIPDGVCDKAFRSDCLSGRKQRISLPALLDDCLYCAGDGASDDGRLCPGGIRACACAYYAGDSCNAGAPVCYVLCLSVGFDASGLRGCFYGVGTGKIKLV